MSKYYLALCGFTTAAVTASRGDLIITDAELDAKIAAPLTCVLDEETGDCMGYFDADEVMQFDGNRRSVEKEKARAAAKGGDAMSDRERELADKQAALDEREAEVKKREADLKKRQAELDKAQNPAGNKAQTPAANK